VKAQPEFKDLSREEILICKAYPDAFISTCCWVSNPFFKQKVQPFTLWPYQKEFITILEYGVENGIGIHNDKSRKMGFSWLFMAYGLWGVSFVEGFSFYVFSITGSEVDNGGSKSTLHSLFGRLRFMHNKLPDGHPLKAPLVFKQGQVYHEEHPDRFMHGGHMGSDPARGGNYSLGLWDESAHAKIDGGDIWIAFESAVNCPVLNSTPRGEDNEFARLKTSKGLIHTSYHWTTNPIYVEKKYTCKKGCRFHNEGGVIHAPWYDKRTKNIHDPWKAAQEYDISYSRSTSNMIFTEFNERIHVAKGDIDYNYKLPLYTGWDFGISDPTVILWVQEVEGNLIVIDCFHDDNKVMDYFADVLLSRYPGSKYTGHFGDPAGKSRGARLESATSVLAEYNIHIQSRQWTAKLQANDKILAIKSFLRTDATSGEDRPRIIISKHKCKYLISALKGAAWPTDQQGNVVPDTTMKKGPHRHPVDALGYLILNLFPSGKYHWPSGALTLEDYEIRKRVKSRGLSFAGGTTIMGNIWDRDL
tara:strand:- start:4281 stop:5870 length:1590 start_codon:yes stop_codon:yes gene_type:complete